jgi:hypothetical protein
MAPQVFVTIIQTTPATHARCLPHTLVGMLLGQDIRQMRRTLISFMCYVMFMFMAILDDPMSKVSPSQDVNVPGVLPAADYIFPIQCTRVCPHTDWCRLCLCKIALQIPCVPEGCWQRYSISAASVDAE